MTNEEKAHRICKTITSIYGVDIAQEAHIYSAALEAMQWKDEQFEKEKKEIDEQWKRLMAESKSIGVDLLQRKEKQIVSRAKKFIKEIARVCDITDENGYRVDERYLLTELEKSMKGEIKWQYQTKKRQENRQEH